MPVKILSVDDSKMVRLLVTKAFKKSRIPAGKFFETGFEHGQWWVLCENGAQYSVEDAFGPGTIDGFDFEQVTEPDDND